MKTGDLRDHLMSLIELVSDAESELYQEEDGILGIISWEPNGDDLIDSTVHDFEELGLLTNDKGFRLTLKNGQKFDISINEVFR
jgi:hypothetical protein